MPNQYWAEVLSNEEVTKDFYLMAIKHEELTRAAKPGQFLHIKVSPGLTPLLRRPISIHDIEGEVIKILYQVIGEGTRLLTEFKPGQQIDVMGPLGNGFNFDSLPNNLREETGTKKVAVVAGGIGIAPLLCVVKKLVAEGLPVALYHGARSKEYLLGKEMFSSMDIDYKVVTDDGSEGEQGFVTSLLEADLKDNAVGDILACGPHLMLEAVGKLANAYKVPAQLSLEERMGCGTGACLACVCKIKTKLGEGQFTYKKVCIDGPVFDAEEVVFND